MPFEKGHKHSKKNVGGTAVDGTTTADRRTNERKAIDRGRQLVRRLTVVGRTAFIGLEKPHDLFDGRPIQLGPDDHQAALSLIREANALMKYMPGVIESVEHIASAKLDSRPDAAAA